MGNALSVALVSMLLVLPLWPLPVSGAQAGAVASPEPAKDAVATDRWLPSGPKTWQHEGAEVTASPGKGKGFLVSPSVFGDFRLSVSFWVDEHVNSGIFIRCADPQTISPGSCYELNIWDRHPQQEWRTGAVVLMHAPLAQVATINRWNTYEIVAVGSHVQAWINGTKVIDFHDEQFARGHIALQSFDAGVVRFSALRIDRL